MLQIARKNYLASALTLLVVVLGGWLGWTKVELYAATTGLERAEDERDRLALEASAERARADGWEDRFGVETGDLQREVAKRDGQAARLVADLAQARARLGWLAEVNVTLRGQVEGVGTEVPPDELPEPDTQQWRGTLTDSLLTTDWSFTLPPARLALSPYMVNVSGELIGTEGGDGSRVIFARASDPRVTLSLGSYTFQPPPPEFRDRCSWTRQGFVFLGGIATGALLKR
jgi:hypothetical protein